MILDNMNRFAKNHNHILCMADTAHNKAAEVTFRLFNKAWQQMPQL